MADNNLSIQIKATLNPKSSITEINKAIRIIEKDPALSKLNINIGVTDTQINNIIKQITQIQEKLKSAAKPIPFVDPEQEAKLKSSLTTIDQAIAKVKDLGTVKISNDSINPLTGAIEKFTLTVNKGKGEIEKFKYELASLNGLVIGGQENQLFVPTKNSTVNNKDAEILKQIQVEQQNELKLNQQLIDSQEKVSQSLKKTYDQGLLTNEVFQQFNTSINGVKDIEQLDLIQKAVQSTIQAEKNLIQQQELISKSQGLINTGKISDTSGLQTLLTSLKSIDPASATATRDLSLLQTQLKEISTSAKSAGENANTFGTAMKSAFMPLTMYFGGFMLFMQGINALKSGISTVDDLNKSLTTIAMITHETQDQVAALGDQYQKLGNQLSISTTEIAASAAELIRQGLSIDEVNKRLVQISEFSKVAGISAQDATTYITAATNSMQISASKATDTFALLGHVSGVNAAYIATAFQKVGGTAGALGLDFQKVASWITTEGERTKESSETIGSSIKSILARVQSLRQNGFDETDGTKVNQVSKALATIGIQLVNSKGQFNDFGSVMDQIGAKWGSLDSRHRAYIATTVAGTYQQSRFLDLMQGYSRSMDLYKQSLDSAGTTQSKFNEWQQGTEAQIAKLTNTMQGFWMSAFKSQDIQLALGGLNDIVSGLKTLTDSFGFLPTILGGVTASLLLFNTNIKNSFQKLVANIKIAYTEMGVFSKSLLTVGEATALSSGNMSLFSKAMLNLQLVGRGTGVVFQTLGVAIKGFAISLGTTLLPVAAIMLISAGIEKLTEAIANQKAQEEALQKQTQNTIDAYSNHKSKIDDLVKSYEQLSNQQKNGGLTTDKEQQYVDVQNELAKLLPAIKDGENAKGNAILKSSSAIKDQIDLLKEQIQLEKDQKKNSAPLDIKNNADAINKTNVVVNIGGLQQQLDYSKNLSDRYEEQLKVLKDSKATKSSIAELEGQINTELTKQSNLQNQIDAKNKTISSSIKNYFSDSKLNTDTISQISTALSTISLKGKSENEIDGMFSSMADSVNKLNTVLKDGNQNAIDKAEKGLEKLGVKGKVLQVIIEALTGSQKDNTKATKDAGLSDDQMAKDLQDAQGNYSALLGVMQEYTKAKEYDKSISIAQNEAYQALSTNLQPVNKLLEDLANGQSLSASAAMDLISKNQDLAKYISITGNTVQINTQGIIDWRDAQISSYDDAIKAVEQEAISVANATLSDLKNYDLQIKTIKNVADAKKALAEINKIQAATDGMGYPGQTASDNLDKSKQAIQDILDIEDQISKVQGLADSGLKETGTSMDKASSSAEKSTYVTDKYKNSIDSLNTALDKLKSIQQQYPQYSQAYRNALTEENKLIQQQIDLTKSQASNLQQQISSGNIQQTGMITSSSSSSGGSGGSAVTGSYTGQYASYINQAAAQYGVNPNLVAAIIKNESSFNQNAHSSAGAIGLMQLMPGTAKSLGVNPNDAYQNILGGTKYIAQLISTFGGDLTKAVEAYNAGPGNIKKGIIPAETQKYVKAVLASYSAYGGGSGGTYSGETSSDSGKAAADQAQAVDQAKSQYLQYLQQIQQYQDQFQANLLEIVKSNEAAFDETKKQYESQLTMYDYLQNVYDKSSKEWLDTQVKRENAYKSEIDVEKQSIDYVQQQIQYNNQLNAAQKATLSDDVLQRQQDLISLEQKLYDTRSQMATQIIDTYKQALTSMKDAATKSIDDMVNEINKTADQADYKKKLQDAQKSAQDIQDQINKLMLDDSASAKKQVADLQKQLADQSNSITQMISDNDKQTRIDNLNDQKQIVSDYYDNMLNDEQKFSDMRSSILNLSNQSVIDDLNKFSKTIQQNTNLLGTSVVNNLISLINQANGYMGVNKQLPTIPVASFDTGGMTSAWGSDGKLAMLHEKEMILNKFDTSNILKAVDLTRNFVSNLKIPDFSKLKFAPQMATPSGNSYSVHIAKVEVTGDQNGAKELLSEFVNGVKRLGGKFN